MLALIIPRSLGAETIVGAFVGVVTATAPDCSSATLIRQRHVQIVTHVLAGGIVLTEATAAAGTRSMKVANPVSTNARTTCAEVCELLSSALTTTVITDEGV